MLICLPAENIYDKQLRVAAHRHTPTAREELKKLRALATRLQELGVQRIICSDLDGQSGETLGRRLNVPVEEWQSLRRRNWGKLHGTPRERARQVLDTIVEHTVPVKGGDSYASFSKRVEASLDRLRAAQGVFLLIVEPEVLERLTGASGAARYRIYDVDLKEERGGGHDQQQAAAVHAGA